MNQKWLVGVDIGGTSIKIAFINEDGEIVHKWEMATEKSNHGQLIPLQIANSIHEKINSINENINRFLGIGVGAPGPVNTETGTVERAINLGWRNFPLKDLLENELRLPVSVDNDANLAAIGEMWKGAGVGKRHIICVTLGTGVGGGIIVNGKIVHGVSGAGGEIGHMKVVTEGGAPCNCGNLGCLETVASATGIVRMAKEQLLTSNLPTSLRQYSQSITAQLVFEATTKGDVLAKEIVDRVAYYLGLSLGNIANCLNPEMVVIGGGVSKAGDTLILPLRNYLKEVTFPRVAESLQVVTAKLGNDAGVIGGAWVALENGGRCL